MPYRNQFTNEYNESRPQRIRLSDLSTRTNEDITDKLLEETGWIWEDYPPEPEPIIEINTTSTNTNFIV